MFRTRWRRVGLETGGSIVGLRCRLRDGKMGWEVEGCGEDDGVGTG